MRQEVTSQRIARKRFWDSEWGRCSRGISDNLGPLLPKEVFGEGRKVLELGCGFAGPLIDRYPVAAALRDYTGVDIAKSILARSAASIGNAGSANFVNADITSALPFKDRSFDFVVSADTMSVLGNEMRLAAEEALRVLRPGGMLIFNISHSEMFEATGKIWQSGLRGGKIFANNGIEIIAFDEQGISAALDNLGFTRIEAYKKYGTLAVPPYSEVKMAIDVRAVKRGP